MWVGLLGGLAADMTGRAVGSSKQASKQEDDMGRDPTAATSDGPLDRVSDPRFKTGANNCGGTDRVAADGATGQRRPCLFTELVHSINCAAPADRLTLRTVGRRWRQLDVRHS